MSNGIVKMPQRQRHLLCAPLNGDKPRARPKPSEKDRFDFVSFAGFGDRAVMFVHGAEQGPHAVVNDFTIPPDVLGNAHCRAKGDEATVMRVDFTDGVLKRHQSAGSRWRVALEAFIQGGLRNPSGGMDVACRAQRFSEIIVEAVGVF